MMIKLTTNTERYFCQHDEMNAQITAAFGSVWFYGISTIVG